jgi:DUF1680 family protein
LTQIAADYGISSYFRDADGIYVNLYIPSTLRWKQGDAEITLTQKSEYPFESNVQFEMSASKPKNFSVNFRIPSWADGASLSVNGKRVGDAIIPGKFASIQRQWKTGDRIELELPTRPRLEPINERHPNTVALMSGPLVLFAMTDAAPTSTKIQFLAAKKVGPQKWQAATAAGTLDFLPFTAIADEPYTTYLNVS